MHPQCRITINGRLASGLFMSQLIACTVTDNEGVSSDTVNIVLNDFPNAEIPPKGAEIKVWMGYNVGGLAYMGAFTAEEIEVEMVPYRMAITGKAAEMRGMAKQNMERHWDDATLKTVVSDIASDLGLEPVVGDVGEFEYPYLAQLGESPIHFMERLAQRHDAIFSVKDKKLIFVDRGTGKSASGAALTPVVVTRRNLQPDTARVTFLDLPKVKDVAASYPDRAKGKKVDVAEPSDELGTATVRTQ